MKLTDGAIDVKATALLKLVYLEMVGHDMSWAAFHVLEVMASPKYHQKRVGYLGAVQSFRPDTEVLMLATNLLKKVCIIAGLLRGLQRDLLGDLLLSVPVSPIYGTLTHNLRTWSLRRRQ